METCDSTAQQLEILYSLIGGKDMLAFIDLYLKRNTRNLFDNSDTESRAGCALRGLMHKQLLALSPAQLSEIIVRGVPQRSRESEWQIEDVLEDSGGTLAAVSLEYLFLVEPAVLTLRLTGQRLLQELAAATLIDVFVETYRLNKEKDEATP